jgi:uncharacterized protein with PIN domain/sulfur carrier protein ThiS
MIMASASFRFCGDLGRFLKREYRERAFSYACARAATLKNAIEALGVPHTEVGLVTVNGEPATLQRIVREGDAIEVHPWEMRHIGSVPIFLADAHLGGLARFLRMAGFDTLHAPNLDDAQIRRIAELEERVVLTRDRELLKCREIGSGYYVRALKPQAQLREVAARYRLAAQARPFTLCLECNLPLRPVEKACVVARLPEQVLQLHDSFMHCHGCDRVFWPGSHYERMAATLSGLLP